MDFEATKCCHLMDQAQVEALGRSCNDVQLLALWREVPDFWRDVNKLAALLVGVPPAIFSAALMALSAQEVDLFCHGSLSEPLLHQLTLHAHTLERSLVELGGEIMDLQCKINLLEPLKLTAADVELFCHSIESIRKKSLHLTSCGSMALSIVWIHGRVDLIDRLSSLKEESLRFERDVIGFPPKKQKSATGIYWLLETKLQIVFGDPATDADALYDDDPAVEALAKLAIWYPEDFQAIGIISEDTGESYLEIAERRLKQSGLLSVGDFKRQWICSQSILRDYLSQAEMDPFSL